MTQIARMSVGIGLALAATATDAAAQGSGRCRGSGLSCDELRCCCSLGDQTPASARVDCVRAGLW
jgi:hypothetical protein